MYTNTFILFTNTNITVDIQKFVCIFPIFFFFFIAFFLKIIVFFFIFLQLNKVNDWQPC